MIDRALAIAAILATAVAPAGLASANAQSPPCTVEVNRVAASAGTAITITVGGLAPGHTFVVSIGEHEVSGITDARGIAEFHYTLPESTPMGTLEIGLVEMQLPGCTARAELEVEAVARGWPKLLTFTVVFIVAIGSLWVLQRSRPPSRSRSRRESLRHQSRKGMLTVDEGAGLITNSSGPPGSQRREETATTDDPLAGSPVVAPRAAPMADPVHPDASRPIVVGTPIAHFEPRPPTWDSEGLQYRPDTVADGFATTDFVLRGASVRGYSHRYYGDQRQDDIAMSVVGNRRLIVAAADGVSAARLSHIGASFAARFAVNWVIENWHADQPGSQIDWPLLVQHTAWGLAQQGGTLMGTAPDPSWAAANLATTLVCAAIDFSGGAGAEVSATTVGDSGLWRMTSDRFELISGGKDTDVEIFSSAVSPLPYVPDLVVRIHTVIEPGSVLLIGSDGFGDALGDGAGLVGEHFARHLATPPSLGDFVRALDFSRELFDDDRSLVAVWPAPAEGSDAGSASEVTAGASGASSDAQP